MILELGFGTALIAGTAIIHTIGLIAMTAVLGKVIDMFRLQQHGPGKILAMVLAILGLFGLHGIEIWAWAFAYMLVGALPDLSTSLYFSTATFSTLGYGDVVLPGEWRLLGSMEGINGFLLIGWSTAYLVAASTRFGPFRAGHHF